MADGYDYEAVIVGAGVAGLSCARALAEHGVTYAILEKSDRPGGRIKTDHLEGFHLDHGFQVVQTGYPGIEHHLDLEALELKAFPAGVTIRHGGKFHAVADPRRHPEHLFSTVAAPIGGFGDRLRMLKLAVELSRRPMQKIFEDGEEKTADFLKRKGFSEQFISAFFTPFFAGASLDLSLEASSRVLKYVTRLFATGEAALPKDGMGAVPDQLAAGLAPGCLQLNREVAAIDRDQVRLADGTLIRARNIVAALPEPVLRKLLNMTASPTDGGGAVSILRPAGARPSRTRFCCSTGKAGGRSTTSLFQASCRPATPLRIIRSSPP